MNRQDAKNAKTAKTAKCPVSSLFGSKLGALCVLAVALEDVVMKARGIAKERGIESE